MNILMVGNGKGSWTMRGEQLGAALGARVTHTPSAADWAWADVAVLIKRASRQFAAAARQAGVSIVWDALDFWRQPADNGRSEKDARQMLGAQIAEIRPALTLGATQAMADACGGVYVPHHSWAGLTPAPARETVHTVAYEGNALYLGQWHKVLVEACARRGWQFVVNPPDLLSADILVALRDGVWDGYMPREWKSGVKVVNAIAAGRPIIGQSSAALRELTPPHSVVSTPADIEAAFDWWTDEEPRAAAVEACRALAPSYTLAALADQYRAILREMEARCAAA